MLRETVLQSSVHDIKSYAVLSEDSISEEYRCIKDICSTQIEEPCRLHQVCDKKIICTFLLHLCSYSSDLILCADTCGCQRQFIDLSRLQLRSVLPYCIYKILIPLDNDVIKSSEDILCCCIKAARNDSSVESENELPVSLCFVMLSDEFCHEFLYGRNSRLCHSHELYLCACKLLFSLEEVSSVSPYPSSVLSDDQLTGLTCKVGHESTCFKIVIYIF